MGEVYRAHDTRVGRDVAIKISADQFSDRFQFEARAIAALNHPNICQLYDVGPDLPRDGADRRRTHRRSGLVLPHQTTIHLAGGAPRSRRVPYLLTPRSFLRSLASGSLPWRF